MALGIGKDGSGMQHYMQSRDKLSTEKKVNSDLTERLDNFSEGEVQIAEDESPAAMLQKFAQATDEMSAIMAQFRNRRDYDKKAGASGETVLDQVLEEDVTPKFDKLVKILKGSDGSNIENLLRQARAFFPDDSDLVLVLREMLRRKNLNEIVRKRLKNLLSKLEKEANPKRLKAGINVALKARLFGKKLMMSPALMRESYRDFLESDEGEIELYKKWISNYGVEKRGIVINFMEDALLADIDSADPSCSHIEFGYLLGRIGQIKLIRSCDIIFIKSIVNHISVGDFNREEGDWIYFMFGVLENPSHVSSLLMDILGDCLRFARKSDRAKLLQTIYTSCKRIPLEAFSEPENREVLLNTLEIIADKTMLEENIERRQEAK
ncbi:type III secretion system gatekeeper subunit SctW [Erwinia tasmaniensis]|uniref:type III secretion system gatekeeper subunit SctW n=1 Tax=Erwinia tasmaniensis TaxID=338565 RepID=UPI003A4E6078